MGERATIRFSAPRFSSISFDLITHMPDLHDQPLVLEFFLNETMLSTFSLIRRSWLHLLLLVPESLRAEAKTFELEVRASRTWQPRPADDASRDDRELSVAVCNIELVG
jgi:hypothetical protein